MADREFTNINGIKVCDQTARNNIPTKTSQLTNDSGYITSVPDEYITETELNTKGYATTSQIPTVPTNVSEFNNDAHYASETFVSNKIAEASLSGGEVDLSGYVTKETGNASQITFADGQTFQAKLDAGLLKGGKGDPGEQGPKGDKGDTGEQGPQGPAGTTEANGVSIIDAENNFTSTNVEGALAELFQSVSNGKTLIASAITDKGVTTSNTGTFQQMANNISRIQGSGELYKDPYREGRILVWEDDFDGNTLDTNSWNYETGYVRNNELQNYTDSTNNVYIENSNLIIKAIKEKSTGYKKGVGMTTFDWSSGSINTNNKHEFQYGRLEAKIKIPQTFGSFPAFWTLGYGYEYVYSEDENRGGKGLNWPYCGEMDIMEHKTGSKKITAGFIYNTDINSSTGIDLGRVNSGDIDFNEYHIYALEWTKDKLDIYVDDILISSSDISDSSTYFMFKTPHYLLLNLAVGAGGGTPGDNINEYIMYVDWVRVYAPVALSSPSISISNTTKSININDTCQLDINFLDDYNSDRTIKWASDNTSVATVYGGKVAGVANGVANITATTSNGDVVTCVVTVGGTIEGGGGTEGGGTDPDNLLNGITWSASADNGIYNNPNQGAIGTEKGGGNGDAYLSGQIPCTKKKYILSNINGATFLHKEMYVYASDGTFLGGCYSGGKYNTDGSSDDSGGDVTMDLRSIQEEPAYMRITAYPNNVPTNNDPAHQLKLTVQRDNVITLDGSLTYSIPKYTHNPSGENGQVLVNYTLPGLTTNPSVTTMGIRTKVDNLNLRAYAGVANLYTLTEWENKVHLVFTLDMASTGVQNTVESITAYLTTNPLTFEYEI